jgi:hypothetical protein
MLVVTSAGCGDDGSPPVGEDGGLTDAGPADADRLDAPAPDTGPPCEDGDGDGVASATCGGGDCDDADPTRFPGATEVCDGDDEDCDETTFGPDGDADGFVATTCCNGLSNCGNDCDDTLNTVNPGAGEKCNAGVDDDCNGRADAADGVCVPCPVGYVGLDGDCTDVDECETTGFCGESRAVCTNLPGTFTCSCGPGYATAMPTGALCSNIDECAAASNPCAPGTCVDNRGSYLCACPVGYRLETDPAIGCVDVDECALGTADCDTSPAASCINSDGAFACECPSGFTGTGRGIEGCQDIDECANALDDCDDEPAACVNANGDFSCVCPAGFVGTGRGAGGCLFDDPELGGLVFGGGTTLSPAFAPSVTEYELDLPPARATTSVAAFVLDPVRTTLTIDGTSVASGAAVPVRADWGPRALRIVVRTEAGTSRTYTVSLRRRSAYVKPTPTASGLLFGQSVALSADGNVLAVGGSFDYDNVYVFRRSSTGGWVQEALIKTFGASFINFGNALSLSADGSTLAVGAMMESSAAVGIDGDPTNYDAINAGAAFVFQRQAGGAWAQEAYIKASNTQPAQSFGTALSLSADGSALAVGAVGESSAATGIDGDQTPSGMGNASGAVYVFRRAAGGWMQEAYVKASNANRQDYFGASVALSGDGSVLAAGATGEDSSATGVDGDALSAGAPESGAVYVFRRASGVWREEAYVKASNTGAGDRFGSSLAVSAAGDVLAVGAPEEASSSVGVGADGGNDAATGSGAVYVFRRVADAWQAEAYVKASNTGPGDAFGRALALSGDGSTIVVGAPLEDSAATGINGDATNGGASDSGAAYVFAIRSGDWGQEAYVKPSNTESEDWFGTAVATSGDGNTVAVGASAEDSAAVGVGGDQSDNRGYFVGAVYVF